MDYKEKFEEFLDKMQGLLDNARKRGHIIVRVEDLENAFHELAESEDERIRKEITELIMQPTWKTEKEFHRRKELVAWLEKQSKQKPVTIDIDKMVNDYASNNERGHEEFGKPTNCMIRAYKQGLNDAIWKVVLNPAWSEEDERMKNAAIRACKYMIDTFENSTKDYEDAIAWLEKQKPVEWSEKDIKITNY